MTVSRSALNKAKTPIQRKRLLSIAAAVDDQLEESNNLRGEIREWREENDEENTLDGEENESKIKRLDSETGQTIMGIDSKETGIIRSTN